MKRNLLYILGVVCLMTSCVEERVKEFEAAPGVEVDFNISMAGGPETKTLYGEESTDGKSIKVNWVTGDLVEIFGTNCSVNQAEYKVTAQDTPTNVAKSLDKTVEVGVRWGDKGTSDFYALYPSDGASFTENTDGSVTLKTKISETQNNVFTLNETRTVELKETINNETKTYNIPVWEGTHFADDAANPSMPSAIMYACTKGAAAKDAQGNLQPVSLHFKPFATVLKFRFMGYTSSLTDPTVYIQNIVVEAPKGYNIAGDFNLGISGTGSEAIATATSANTTAKNVVTLNTILPGGTYLPLKQRQAVEFNVFTMPVDGQKMGKTADSDLWKITINTAQHGSFSYTLAPTADGTVYELKPGKIHKVKVPQLPVNGTIDWNPENWITQIPQPVYISELSVPGAWYCTDAEYQGSIGLGSNDDNGVDIGLKALYNAGVRAFNIDCRLTYESCSYPYTDGSGNLRLVCAGTDKSEGVDGISSGYTKGELVSAKLSSLAKLVKEDEYIVVVLTIAEKPLTRNGTLNDNTGDTKHIFGNVDPTQVLPQIADILNNSSADYYSQIYKEEITSDTTIDDVLGSMIIKVNINTQSFVNNSYRIPSTALLSFASMASTDWDNMNNVDGLSTNYYSEMNVSDIYWGNSATDLKYYYHQAQRTTRTGGHWVNENVGSWLRPDYQDVYYTYEVEGIPTYKQRKNAIDNIIKNSKSIYDSAHHNAWFQVGIGGMRKSADDGDDDASRTEVADTLNAYVLNKINSKMEVDPSPLGIVLMNYCIGNHKGPELIQAIIEMNGKFYLNRQGGSITTGGQGGNGGTTPTPAPAKNAAYAEVGEDAF